MEYHLTSPTASNRYKDLWILFWKYFYSKLYHILFCQCHTMLYNLMFSAAHHRAIPWHSTLLWRRHKWWGDHYNCTLTVTSTKPPVAIWSVYCLECWLIAALSVFTVEELNPALLTEPSGLQISANQPLVSTQFVAVFSSWPASNKLKFLPSSLSSPTLRRQKKKMPERNALDSFQMFCISIFEFPTFLHCIVLACKEVNTVCLLMGLI